MELLELMKQRQSCRNYTQRKVEQSILENCIEAARLAPSACNSQPWKYVVVMKEDYLPVIANSLQKDGFNRFADQCPAFVLVLEQPAMLINGQTGTKSENQKFAQIDIGLSVMQFCLAAQDQGVGTCIMGSFDASELQALLTLPEDTVIRLVIAVGYPGDDKIRPKMRKPYDQIVTYIE
jgi:nitroreductase